MSEVMVGYVWGIVTCIGVALFLIWLGNMLHEKERAESARHIEFTVKPPKK